MMTRNTSFLSIKAEDAFLFVLFAYGAPSTPKVTETILLGGMDEPTRHGPQTRIYREIVTHDFVYLTTK
mgnify:CR=1 FL=1